MPKILMLLTVLISVDGILGTTQNDKKPLEASLGRQNYYKNVAPDVSQMLKALDLTTEKNDNQNLQSAINVESGIKIGMNAQLGAAFTPPPPSPPVELTKGAPTVLPTESPLDIFHEGLPDPNSKRPDYEPPTKELHKLNPISEKHGKLMTTSQSPGSFAMRIAAETFEIDARLGAINSTSHSKNVNASFPFGSENRYAEGVNGLDAEKIKETTDEPPMAEENVTEELGEGTSDSVTTMDPVDEEIRQVLDSLPKLPEFTFSDNNTHFVFHKDPEEAALDDRITQVARQLAETSLRREFEEKKLGHIIPIRLRHFDDDYPASTYSPLRKANTAKSYKNNNNNPLESVWNWSQPQIRFRAFSIPEHIYRESFYMPKQFSPASAANVEVLLPSGGPVYITDTDENTKSQMSTRYNSNALMDILQLSPRYVVPTSREAFRDNRIPQFFDLTQPKQAYPNQNNLRTYPYRGIA